MSTRSELGQVKLEWDESTRTLKVKVESKTVLELTRSQLTINGTLNGATVDADDLELSGEARGDIIRRGATNWERLSAKTANQFLVGDGTDVTSRTFTAADLPTNLKTGYIPLDIGSLRIIAANVIGNTTEGMLLDGNTDPSLQRVNSATDKALRVIWGAASVVEVQFPPITYPPDLDDTAAVTVNLIAAMAGATDTPVIAVSYWENTGDTNAGGNTAAVTGTSLALYSVAIAAGDVGAYPKVANIGLTPAAHGTDALHLYGGFVTYTRKS